MSENKHIFKVQKGEKLNIENSNKEFYKIKLVKDDQEIKLCNPYVGDYAVNNEGKTLHYLIEVNDNKLVEGKIDCNKAKVKVVLDGDQYRLALYESDNSSPIILPKASLGFYRSNDFLYQHPQDTQKLLAQCKTHYDLEKYYNDDDSLIFKVEELTSTIEDERRHLAYIQEKDGKKICLLHSYSTVLDSDDQTILLRLKQDNSLHTWKAVSKYFTIEENENGNHNYYFSNENGDPVDYSGNVDHKLSGDSYSSNIGNASLKNALQDSACFSISEIIKPQHNKNLSSEQLEYMVGSLNERTLKELTDKLCGDQLKAAEEKHKGIINECREKNEKQAETIERLEGLLSDKDKEPKINDPNTVIEPEPTELMTIAVLNQNCISVASNYLPFYDPLPFCSLWNLGV